MADLTLTLTPFISAQLPLHLEPRSRAAPAGAATFRCSAKVPGGRENVCTADALPALGARL